MQRIQYPARSFFVPIVAAAETVTLDKRHQPPSEPRNNYAARVRQGAMVAALAGAILTPIGYPGTANTAIAAPPSRGPVYSSHVISQSTAFVRIDTAEVVTVDKWFAAPHQPTRRKVERQAPYSAWLAQPLPGNATGVVTGSIGGPIFSKALLYQVSAWNPFTPAQAEVVTLDKWAGYEPDSARRIVERQQGYLPSLHPRPTVPFNWYRPLEEPTRRVGQQPARQDYAELDVFPRPFTVQWLQPTSQPTRRIVERQGQQPSYYPFPPFTVEWLQPTSQPTRRVVERQAPLPSYAPFPRPFTIEWYRPASEPTRRVVERQAPLPSLDVFPRPFTTQWLQPLSQPTLRTVQRQAPLPSFDPYPVPAAAGTPGDATFAVSGPQVGPVFSRYVISQTLAYVRQVEADVVVTYDFINGRIGGPIFSKALLYQVYAQTPFTPAAEIVTADKWYAPSLLQPDRRKVERQAPLPSLDPFPRPFTIEWYRPLNEPTRRVVERQSPPPSFYPFPYPPLAGQGQEYNWFLEANQPTRRKGVPVQLQPQPFYGNWSPITTTLEYGWFRPLSEPTRRIVERQWKQADFAPFPTVPFGWFRPLDEPTLRKVTRQGWQHNIDPYPIPPVVVVDYGWFRPLSEPVRTRQYPVFQQDEMFGPIRITVPFNWYRPLEEPTRRKQTRLEQYAFHPRPIVTVSWTPLPNTPPIRLVFPTRMQQFLAHVPRVAAGQGVAYNWFVPLETPVRLKIGLATRLQQFFAYYALPLPIDLTNINPCHTIYVLPAGRTFTVSSKPGVIVRATNTTATVSEKSDVIVLPTDDEKDVPCA